MKSFLIIDGNSIMNRAFYGLSNLRMFSKTAGIHTNALYAFLNIYWMILDKLAPDYACVSFDLKAPTFRHKMYEDYKGTRKGMPDELAEQMPVIKEVLSAMNVPIIETSEHYGQHHQQIEKPIHPEQDSHSILHLHCKTTPEDEEIPDNRYHHFPWGSGTKSRQCIAGM